MANAWYGKALERAAGSGLGWNTNAIYAVLVDTNDFTNSLTTFEFLSSIPGGARIATFGPLTSKTALLGVLKAAGYTFTSVTGDQAEAIIYYIHTGSDATASLLVFQDTGTGLPVTPNSGNIAVTLPSDTVATV